MDCSLPSFFVHEILQARRLEWVAIPFFRVSSWPRDQTWVSHIAGRFFTVWANRQAPCGSLLLFSCSVVCDSLKPYGWQYVRLPCPSPSPGTCSNSCPLSQWCHPTISSSVVPFSSCLQSFPATGSFPMSQLFTSGGQTIGASASVLPMNIQYRFPLGLTGLISLESKGLSRVLSNTTVWKYQLFSAQTSL